MDKLKLVDKLIEKTHITYEEAKSTLEISDWNILDAMIHLERIGRIKQPSVSIFYTNENKDNHKEHQNEFNFDEVKDDDKKNYNNFEGVFEAICKAIDKCNNIFIEIRGRNKFFLKIPLTVVIVLLIFGFWIVIPLSIIGLFLDTKFSVSAKKINTDKVNNILREIEKWVESIKEKVKKI